RNTRNASLNRASVKTAPTPTIHQYAPPSRARFSRRIGLRRLGVSSRCGSRTPNRSTSKHRSAGITATVNTAEVVRPQQHQPDGDQRTEERANGVERLPQPEGRSA